MIRTERQFDSSSSKGNINKLNAYNRPIDTMQLKFIPFRKRKNKNDKFISEAETGQSYIPH